MVRYGRKKGCLNTGENGELLQTVRTNIHIALHNVQCILRGNCGRARGGRRRREERGREEKQRRGRE